ncbi:MAG: DUF362 domain-containing protein [Pseudomonadota bacterium]
MDESQLITRRETLKRLLQISGGIVLSSVTGWPRGGPGTVWAKTGGKRFIVEGLGQKEGYDIKALVRKVFDGAGGMTRFVSRGDVVVIKPNLSWARRPEMAATTNPEVLEGVIDLCHEAGAKVIRIADHTIHDARRCFALSGAGLVAKKTDADLIFPRSSLMKEMKIRGHRLDVWPVYLPLVEADKIINLPIAKDHVLSTLTLGMKGWIGGVGGRRNVLHQDIHQTVVDLAQFFKPTVTLIDAIKVMTKNGPSGGSLGDVAVKNTLILSDDPVAADALASKLFGHKPEDIGFIRLAQKQGLGTYDLNQLEHKKVLL